MSEPVDGILARLDLVGVEARRRSAEIESQRALPRDLLEALVDTGVFRLTVPTALGGAAAELSAVLRAIRTLAAHDASTAWVVMSALFAGLDAAGLPRHHASTVLGEPRTVVAGHRGAGGTARRTDDGGLVVTGRWSWGSGVATSSWITAGVRIPATPEAGGAEQDESEPNPAPVADLGIDLDVLCLFRRDQVVVLDTWHAIGLHGAGATDFEVIEAFVPEGRWIGPLDSVPADLVALGAAAVALGLADRAIDEAGHLAPAESYNRSMADLGATGAFLEQVTQSRDAGSAPTDPTPAASLGTHGVAAALQAVETSVAIVERFYRLGGPSAVLHASVLQRLLRDVQTVAQHPSVSPGRWGELGHGSSAAGH